MLYMLFKRKVNVIFIHVHGHALSIGEKNFQFVVVHFVRYMYVYFLSNGCIHTCN